MRNHHYQVKEHVLKRRFSLSKPAYENFYFSPKFEVFIERIISFPGLAG